MHIFGSIFGSSDESSLFIDNIISLAANPVFKIFKELDIKFHDVKQYGHIYMFMTQHRIILYDTIRGSWTRVARFGKPYNVSTDKDHYIVYYDGDEEGNLVVYVKKDDPYYSVNRNLLCKLQNKIESISDTDKHICLTDSKQNAYIVDKLTNVFISEDVVAFKATTYAFSPAHIRTYGFFSGKNAKELWTRALSWCKIKEISTAVEVGGNTYYAVYDPIFNLIRYSLIDKSTSHISTKHFTGSFSVDRRVQDSEELKLILTVLIPEGEFRDRFLSLKKPKIKYCSADGALINIAVKSNSEYHLFCINRETASVVRSVVSKEKMFISKTIDMQDSIIMFDFVNNRYMVVKENEIIKSSKMRQLTPTELASILTCTSLKVNVSGATDKAGTSLLGIDDKAGDKEEDEEEDTEGEDI